MFDYVARIAVAGMLSCAVLCPVPLAAQESAPFPAKPVRMVIHIGPGSSMDIVGRVLAQELTEAWGHTVVVDNRAGAGGIIGMDAVAKAPEMRVRLAGLGADSEGTSPSEFAAYFRGDIDKWANVVKAAKVSVD